MRTIQKWSPIVLFVLVIAWLVAVGPGATAHAKGGPNACPMIYAPVICDGGKIYPNQCEADRKHARNCVPLDFQTE